MLAQQGPSAEPDPTSIEQDEELDPRLRHNYGSAEYWEARYATSDADDFDWLGVSFPQLSPVVSFALSAHPMPTSARVLVLGCGNSSFSQQLYQAGVSNILNIDIAQAVISKMSLKLSTSCPAMQWAVMDATNITLPDHSVDLIFDKTMLDCLFCSEDKTHPQKMLFHCKRILSPSGSYICVSFSNESDVMAAMTSAGFSLRCPPVKMAPSGDWGGQGCGDQDCDHAHGCGGDANDEEDDEEMDDEDMEGEEDEDDDDDEEGGAEFMVYVFGL